MAENTAEKVIAHPAATRQDKVYNYQLTFVCGKNLVQGQFLTDFPQSMDEATLAQSMDMLDRLARRQQARYALDELEQEVEDREAQMAQWKLDHGEAEKAFRRVEAEIKDKIRKADGAENIVIQNAKADHAASRRGGDATFELRGEPKKKVTAYEREKKQFVEELAKQAAERDAATANLAVNIAAAEKQIAKLRAKIASKQTVLESGQ